MYATKKFKGADANDYVKLAKMLIACRYVLGYEQAKYKISPWLWILLEDKSAWDKFPLGSISYQILKLAIDNVRTTPSEASSGPVYHLIGNTVAFTAWIFCVIPNIGKKIGCVFPQHKRPRMLRCTYAKNNDNIEIYDAEVKPSLKPYKKELKKSYWKSLENDPEKESFCFKYDHNEKKRKRPAPNDNDDIVAGNVSAGIDGTTTAGTTSNTTAALSRCIALSSMSTTDRASLIKEIGDYAGEVAVKRARIEMQQMVKEVGNYLLQNSTNPAATMTTNDNSPFSSSNRLISSRSTPDSR